MISPSARETRKLTGTTISVGGAAAAATAFVVAALVEPMTMSGCPAGAGVKAGAGATGTTLVGGGATGVLVVIAAIGGLLAVDCAQPVSQGSITIVPAIKNR